MESNLLNFIKENVEQVKEEYNLSSKDVEKVSNIIRNDQRFLNEVLEALIESLNCAIGEISK